MTNGLDVNFLKSLSAEERLAAMKKSVNATTVVLLDIKH